MSDKGGLRGRWEALRSQYSEKQVRQDKIFEAAAPFLRPSERLLCPPAPGTFFPWSALAVRNQLVRRVLAVALFPLVLISEFEGLPASFLVTDSRVMVLKRRLGIRVTSLPVGEIKWVSCGGRSWKNHPGTGGASEFEVVEVLLRWRDQPLRIRFQEPWLEEGEAIARGLVARLGTQEEQWRSDAASRSDDEMRKGWAKLRDLGQISQAEYEARIADLD